MMKKILLLASLLPFALSAGTYGDKAKDTSSDENKEDIVAVAAGNDAFSTLVAAVKAADLVETLQGDGPFTVFAPTDEAFAALPEGTLEMLLKPENKDQLIEILTYHVVPAKVMAADVAAGSAPTVNGTDLQIAIKDGNVMVNDATVVMTDVMASNGVIHVVDSVILPPADDKVAAAY
ncbi:MAG: fasciclin domain-containing protein [Opitutales bacterium]